MRIRFLGENFKRFYRTQPVYKCERIDVILGYIQGLSAEELKTCPLFTTSQHIQGIHSICIPFRRVKHVLLPCSILKCPKGDDFLLIATGFHSKSSFLSYKESLIGKDIIYQYREYILCD